MFACLPIEDKWAAFRMSRDANYGLEGKGDGAPSIHVKRNHAAPSRRTWNFYRQTSGLSWMSSTLPFVLVIDGIDFIFSDGDLLPGWWERAMRASVSRQGGNRGRGRYEVNLPWKKYNFISNLISKFIQEIFKSAFLGHVWKRRTQTSWCRTKSSFLHLCQKHPAEMKIM